MNTRVSPKNTSAVRYPIEGVIYRAPEEAANYLANGAWVDSTVGDSLRSIAKVRPQKFAFISDERSITFQELDEETERLGAALLDSGMCPGDRAIFQLGTNVETVVVLFACYKAGIVPVCSLPQHREIEIGQLARQSRATGYFVQSDFSAFDLVTFAQTMLAKSETLQHLYVTRGDDTDQRYIYRLLETMPLDTARQKLAAVSPSREDVLSFQLSGGTTGIPKIIPRFHAEYLGHSSAWMEMSCLDSSSRIIWSLPILHNAGQLYALISVALKGSTTVLMPKVDIRRMLELIESHKVTHAVSIGPVAPQLLAYPDVKSHDLSSLIMFGTMSRSDNLEKHLSVTCSNLYGITEGLLLGSSPKAPAESRHQTQGRSGCPYDEIKLLDPESEISVPVGTAGELCFRGPSTLTGFFDSPEANSKAFTSDGFYRTGDMVTARVIDGHTYYSFEGRLRDNINRGGEKIGSEEVEGLVSQHPSVADAKLVAMPDPFYGEKACVYLILRPGKDCPNVKELAAFLSRLGLAKYKCPERIEVIDAFPLTRVGKVDKPALKQRIGAQLASEVLTAN